VFTVRRFGETNDDVTVMYDIGGRRATAWIMRRCRVS